MDTVKAAVTLSCACVFVWFACLCVPAQVAGLVPVPAKEAASGRGSQKNTYTNACTHEHPLAPYLKGSDSSGSQCASEAPSHYHSFQDLSVLSGVETREKHTSVFCILPSPIRFHSPLSFLSYSLKMFCMALKLLISPHSSAKLIKTDENRITG